MDTAIVLFTRDLRLHDNPALHEACRRARRVVPLFVADPAIKAPANRARFLAESLADLRHNLRERGGDLITRTGAPAEQVMTLAAQTQADAVFLAGDVSRYAARRRETLAKDCAQHRLDLVITEGLTVVPPGQLTPAAGDAYRVFTPYWRAWAATRWREPCPAPKAIELPAIDQHGIDQHGIDQHGRLPAPGPGDSPSLLPGGEQAARRRLATWCAGPLARYDDGHDDLAADRTSRLGAYLRFGCVSPLQVALAAQDHPGGAEFTRQLAWRDFFYQATAAFPDLPRRNYRSAPSWRRDDDALDAWRAGQTGIPIVDAGLRQLAAEGFMHNRARMITASFLTRQLGIDWRHGYRHFAALLTDGDVPNNAGNWQWVAGTGHNTRPNRVMNPLRQASRFDRSGDYVRRYVPELADVTAPRIHTPWQLPAARRRQLRYPAPITEIQPQLFRTIRVTPVRPQWHMSG